VPQIDLVVSEAQSDYSDTAFDWKEIDIDKSDRWAETPVATPTPSFDSETNALVRPDWTLTLHAKNDDNTRFAENRREPGSGWERADDTNGDTAGHLLMVEVEKYAGVHFTDPTDANDPDKLLLANQCVGKRFPANCEAALEQFILSRMQRYSSADVVLLQRRDLWTGWVAGDYKYNSAWCGDQHPGLKTDHCCPK
jgi:hypothetical protein